jgi:hypothetical protein
MDGLQPSIERPPWSIVRHFTDFHVQGQALAGAPQPDQESKGDREYCDHCLAVYDLLAGFPYLREP